MITVDWNCPECLANNKDDYSQTVRPACGECGLDFEWGEVLDPCSISNLNTALENMGREKWKAELRQMIADLETQWEELDQKIEQAATRHQSNGGKGIGLDAGWMRKSQQEIGEKLTRYQLQLEEVSNA